jgi:phosphoribosylamine--glycine ligase
LPEPGWRILVVGQGGREHALVQSLAASPHVTTVYCAPGNPGTAQCATNVPIGAEDLDRLVDWAIAKDVDFVVVGPEAPLVAGLVDRLEAADQQDG